MKTVEKQIIVKDNGYSWLGFWTLNKNFNEALQNIHDISKYDRYKTGEYANAYWVLDSSGACVAAQPSKQGALKYYNTERVLVHYQNEFVTY